MKRNMLAVIIVAIIAVAGVIIFIGTSGYDDESLSGSSQALVEADTKSAEYKQFKELKGEEFDRMFLANMIAHHEGAVEMANLALTAAMHPEIKTLAQNIVTAQRSEITNMLQWQKDWGYPASSGDMMEDHSAMGMMDDNATMMEALAGKSGDEFDKAFLEQMIMHHKSAINMSAAGVDNARHEEVKNLTTTIIAAQSAEIKQMQQWQKDWGYSQ